MLKPGFSPKSGEGATMGIPGPIRTDCGGLIRPKLIL